MKRNKANSEDVHRTRRTYTQSEIHAQLTYKQPSTTSSTSLRCLGITSSGASAAPTVRISSIEYADASGFNKLTN